MSLTQEIRFKSMEGASKVQNILKEVARKLKRGYNSILKISSGKRSFQFCKLARKMGVKGKDDFNITVESFSFCEIEASGQEESA